MPRDDLILFLDLETTGTDERLDNIIEVGIAMLDAETLVEKDAFSRVVAPYLNAYERMMAKDVVREMHEKNGLLDDVRARIRESGSRSISDVDTELIDWLRQHVGRDTTQIPYGGSGVGHFDRRFIKRYLPRFDKMITHWAYDVGVMRRMFKKAGVTPADELFERIGQDGKTHRALDDARVHAAEFRYYQTFIRGES